MVFIDCSVYSTQYENTSSHHDFQPLQARFKLGNRLYPSAADRSKAVIDPLLVRRSDRTIQFSMKCIPELSEAAASTEHPCFVSNLPQIRNPHQPILAGECQRLVYALRLGHAEDSMFASIVNLDMFAVFDCQLLVPGKIAY